MDASSIYRSIIIDSWPALRITYQYKAVYRLIKVLDFVRFGHGMNEIPRIVTKGTITDDNSKWRCPHYQMLCLSPHIMSGTRVCGSLTCVLPLRGDWAIFCHAVSGRVGREKSLETLWELNRATEMIDNEIHYFSHWAIMTNFLSIPTDFIYDNQ